MRTSDPDSEQFAADLLASARNDGPAPEALDRELRRLGVATLTATATAAVLSSSAAPPAMTGAANGAGAAPGVGAAGTGATAKIGAGASILSSVSLAKVGMIAVIAVMSASGYVAIRDSRLQVNAKGESASAGVTVDAPSRVAADAIATAQAATSVTPETPGAVTAPPSGRTEHAASTATRTIAMAATAPEPTGSNVPVVAEKTGLHSAATARSAAAARTVADATGAPPALAVVSSAPPATTPPAMLAEEVRLIDRARALARSSPTTALALLDEHDRTFAGGSLHDEAAVVRLEAMIAAGRRPEAERYAAPFLRDRAGTPIARRMHALLGL